MKAKPGSKGKSVKEKDAEHPLEKVRVRKIQGQLEGIEKMMADSRHCPQIIQQVQAVVSALGSLKVEILKRYLDECLAEAQETSNYNRLKEQAVEIVRMRAWG
ncbi:MAG: metal-sensitive transcriptional regulator [Bdellovibrionales bacterium]|nr:metal-sensitive transcriptional regulator [Bdellovibrionales bacterium]